MAGVRGSRAARVAALLVSLVAPSVSAGGVAHGQDAEASPSESDALWRDATAETTGATGGWTNKVDVADIDGDGQLDIIHANGGDYDTPGTPERQGIYLNTGPGQPFTDATDEVFGDARFLARVIRPRDVTGDGIVDLLVGTTFQTQSRLYRGLGGGAFEDATALLLPEMELSVGDLEVGDVDADGDLDIVLADWGPGSPMESAGAPVRLWRNSGEGFVDDAEAMPTAAVGFSWDLELVDVDLDWDLDIATSCKVCATSRLYLNDGAGTFSDVTAAQMPGFTNNYEFEAMDLDGDGDPELVTINDGPAGPFGATEHVFRNDDGTFVDATAEWWPADMNPGYDDNVEVFLDVDSDADADMLVGSLDGPDRLMINDGAGNLTMDDSVFSGPVTPGTLGLAVGDIDGDGRLDVVEGEGELAPDDHVFLATDAMPPDTVGPRIEGVMVTPLEAGVVEVAARIHDRKTPVLVDDFQSLTVSLSGAWDPGPYPLTWYGDALWRVRIDHDGQPPTAADVIVCATDRAGNETCLP